MCISVDLMLIRCSKWCRDASDCLELCSCCAKSCLTCSCTFRCGFPGIHFYCLFLQLCISNFTEVLMSLLAFVLYVFLSFFVRIYLKLVMLFCVRCALDKCFNFGVVILLWLFFERTHLSCVLFIVVLAKFIHFLNCGHTHCVSCLNAFFANCSYSCSAAFFFVVQLAFVFVSHA